MSHNPGFRSIKIDVIIYSPLLLEVQRADNSSSCPAVESKKCIVCGKNFSTDISTKEEIEHVDMHTDVEIAKILTSHHCISEIKILKGDIYDGRCEYGGCQRTSDYRITVKDSDDTSPSFCCNMHIGNILESNHLSNMKCIIERINISKQV